MSTSPFLSSVAQSPDLDGLEEMAHDFNDITIFQGKSGQTQTWKEQDKQSPDKIVNSEKMECEEVNFENKTKTKIEQNDIFLAELQVETCRMKFKHLLPPYLSAKLSKNHLNLITLAQKIDNFLISAKDNMNKQCVLLFELVIYLNNECGDYAQIVNKFKQIIQIDPTFYFYEFQQRQETKQEIRILTTWKQDFITSRGMKLRKSIYDSLLVPQNQSLSNQNQKQMVQMEVEQDLSQSQKFTTSSHLSFKNPEDTLQTVFLSKGISSSSFSSFTQSRQRNQETSSFQQRLRSMISKKQTQMQFLSKEHNSHNLPILSIIGKKRYIRIIDQINSLYYMRKVKSIFMMNLIEGVVKRTGYCKFDVEATIKDIINAGMYLEQIKSQGGTIIRVNIKMYKKLRHFIQTSKE